LRVARRHAIQGSHRGAFTAPFEELVRLAALVAVGGAVPSYYDTDAALEHQSGTRQAISACVAFHAIWVMQSVVRSVDHGRAGGGSMQRRSKSSGIGRLVIACVVLSAVAASCGGDDDESSSAATTTTASVCADREALQTSVSSLQDVDLVAEGTNGVNAAIDDLQEDLSSLQNSAGAELQPEVQAVQDDIDELKTAVEDFDSGGAAAAAAATSDLASSARTLFDSLADGACGSSTTPTT
jgi:hypothetical protein